MQSCLPWSTRPSTRVRPRNPIPSLCPFLTSLHLLGLYHPIRPSAGRCIPCQRQFRRLHPPYSPGRRIGEMTISMTRKQSITFLLGLSIVDRCISLHSKSFRSTNVLLYFFRIISHSFPEYELVLKLSFCKYSLQICIPYGFAASSILQVHYMI